MTRRRLLALLAATPLAFARATRAAEPTKAQPDLPKEHLAIVTRDGVHHEFQVEMAETPEQQQAGEMFRNEIPDGGGMLFDWGAPRVQAASMQNCPVAEDMIFIGDDGTIRHIVERTVPESLVPVGSLVPVRATLRLAAGTAQKLDIRVGDKVLQKIFGNAP